MALIKTITKIKDTRLMPSEAHQAEEKLNLRWGERLKNWSKTAGSNDPYTELAEGGAGVLMNEDKAFHPVISLWPIVEYRNGEWQIATFSTINDIVLDSTERQPASDYSSRTDGYQFVTNEAFYEYENDASPTFNFLLGMRTNIGNPRVSGDFGDVKWDNIPSGGYRILKTNDGTVVKFVKIVRTSGRSPKILFVFYDENGVVIADNTTEVYLRFVNG